MKHSLQADTTEIIPEGCRLTKLGILPRVSTVVKFQPDPKRREEGKQRLIEWLEEWQKENPDLPSDYFAQRGTMLHAACEYRILNDKDPENIHEWALPFYGQVKGDLGLINKDNVFWAEKPLSKNINWPSDMSYEGEDGETRYHVWSTKYGFCGTPDLWATLRAKSTILDYKTTQHPYCSFFNKDNKGAWFKYQKCVMQLAAYKLALEELTGEKITHVQIKAIRADGIQSFIITGRKLEYYESKFLKKLEAYRKFISLN